MYLSALIFPQPLLSPSPMHFAAQSLEKAEAAGDWDVSAALGAHTPDWVATVPRLGLNYASKSEQAPRSQESLGSGNRHFQACGGKGRFLSP